MSASAFPLFAIPCFKRSCHIT